jgi:hypothetical protein
VVLIEQDVTVLQSLFACNLADKSTFQQILEDYSQIGFAQTTKFPDIISGKGYI